MKAIRLILEIIGAFMLLCSLIYVCSVFAPPSFGQAVIKPTEKKTIEASIRSQESYQLRHLYSGPSIIRKILQAEKLKKNACLIYEKGEWKKQDAQFRPEVSVNPAPGPRRLLGAQTPAETRAAILAQDEYEHITVWQDIEDGPTRYKTVDTYQAESLCDGTTPCRVWREKTYIGHINQGYGDWTAETSLI